MNKTKGYNETIKKNDNICECKGKGAMFMKKMICSPGSYVQGQGELGNLPEYVEGLGKKSAYLIVDSFILEHYKEYICADFDKKQMKYELATFCGECCVEEIELHQKKKEGFDVVIGIGGGKTLDTAKAVAFYTHCPVIIAPTVASSDAPCSRLSVVYKANGEFSHYLPLTSNPNIVVMDSAIIAKAPARLLAAGIGDALATFYEVDACRQSNATTITGGHVTKAAFALATLCRDTLLQEGYKAYLAVEQGLCTKAVENIIEANTYLSGIGFESGGLSGAHAIHNGLTVLEGTHHMLHGEKVAFGTITQMVLENRPLEEIEEIVSFCKKLNLPTTLDDLGIGDVTEEQLLEVAKVSCSPEDTMGNLPFPVTYEEVVGAIRVADAIGKQR